MGTISKTTCLQCGHTFMDRSGGGFFFDQFRCENCGKSRDVSHEELGEVYDRYSEKSIDDMFSDLYEEVQSGPNYVVEKDYEKDYENEVENIIGKCKCGGRYLLYAPSRCPKCHSTQLEIDDSKTIFFD